MAVQTSQRGAVPKLVQKKDSIKIDVAVINRQDGLKYIQRKQVKGEAQ